MDNLENKPASPASPATEPSDLRNQLNTLRVQMITTLVLTIMVAGSLNLYLLRQVKYVRSDLAAFKPQATAMLTDYTKNRQMMDEFLKRITDYGRTHPDFAPIMTKYGLGITNVPGTVAVPAPAPKPAAPVKK